MSWERLHSISPALAILPVLKESIVRRALCSRKAWRYAKKPVTAELQRGAFTNLGIVAGSSGEYREARQLFQRSLAIFQALGDLWGEAKVLINLGVIAYYLHEYVEADNFLH